MSILVTLWHNRLVSQHRYTQQQFTDIFKCTKSPDTLSAQNCCILSTSMSLTFDGSLYSGKSLFLIFSYDVAGEAGNNYVLICMVWTRVRVREYIVFPAHGWTEMKIAQQSFSSGACGLFSAAATGFQSCSSAGEVASTFWRAVAT